MERYILLVDDDNDICFTYKMILELEGYRVLTASNGLEALKVLRAESTNPQLIILDLMMPEMDGWTFRQEQLKDPALAEIPVILLSGATELPKQAQELKIKHVLSKPVEIPILLEHIKTYWSEKISRLDATQIASN